MKSERTEWGSRLGFIMAAVGMAIGTGNIWRFPRIVGNNGGGTFVLAYIIANLVWTIPLIMTEMAIGKKTRLGTIGSFKKFVGEKNTWQGGWICFVCAAITFYYVIVLGWSLRYLTFALQGTFTTKVDTELVWNTFTSNPVEGVLFQVIALILVGYVLIKGVNKGLEKAGKIMIPVLFISLLSAAIWALTKEGAILGLKYLFVPNFKDLLKPGIWLNAFTQAAWSSGAGWGMMLTYANYMKENEDIAVNTFMISFGDALGAMISAMAVLPTVFALSASEGAALDALASGNTGLTFIYLTKLFAQTKGGLIISSLFFLALSLAALTSLLPQMEVLIKNIMDFGIARKRAVILMLGICFICGLPSVISMDFFDNQDWVWGIGLLICGIFYTLSVYKYGIDKFRTELINPTSDIKVGKWYNYVLKIYPIIVTTIIAWWMIQAAKWSENWLSPFSTNNPGTVIIQCLGTMIIFYFANSKLNSLLDFKSGVVEVNYQDSFDRERI